mmetsp:Transcript_93438/g.150837  ORF Transcript_93438/g.150837 Transcript_93438/m.150837 type:complete len:250 (-) Transcript_93438:3589-4338(-)
MTAHFPAFSPWHPMRVPLSQPPQGRHRVSDEVEHLPTSHKLPFWFRPPQTVHMSHCVEALPTMALNWRCSTGPSVGQTTHLPLAAVPISHSTRKAPASHGSHVSQYPALVAVHPMMISSGVHFLQILMSFMATKGTSARPKPSRKEHLSAVSESQEVAAHPVAPNTALNVISLKPKLVPDKRISETLNNAMSPSTLDTFGPSYENAFVRVWSFTPNIDTTTALARPDDPLMSLHVKAESDCHNVAAHCE